MNDFNLKGQKIGYWEEDWDSLMSEKGYYKDGIRDGKWTRFLKSPIMFKLNSDTYFLTTRTIIINYKNGKKESCYISIYRKLQGDFTAIIYYI